MGWSQRALSAAEKVWFWIEAGSSASCSTSAGHRRNQVLSRTAGVRARLLTPGESHQDTETFNLETDSSVRASIVRAWIAISSLRAPIALPHWQLRLRLTPCTVQVQVSQATGCGSAIGDSRDAGFVACGGSWMNCRFSWRFTVDS